MKWSLIFGLFSGYYEGRVILALMPLGVEHFDAVFDPPLASQVILALMPLGVEHSTHCVAASESTEVILALMPLGVEHSSPSRDTRPCACDPRIDAVRR